MVKLFVGNLAYSVEEAELKALFERTGKVRDVYMPLDRVTQRRRGFAMVDVQSDADARAIIRELDGYSLHGRAIRIDYAREREAPEVPAKYRYLYPPKGRPEPGPRRRERVPGR
jgi:RNA recognition motif-containing protein